MHNIGISMQYGLLKSIQTLLSSIPKWAPVGPNWGPYGMLRGLTRLKQNHTVPVLPIAVLICFMWVNVHNVGIFNCSFKVVCLNSYFNPQSAPPASYTQPPVGPPRQYRPPGTFSDERRGSRCGAGGAERAGASNPGLSPN